MATSGVPIAGRLIQIPGLTIVPPASFGGPARCRLNPEDYRMRPGTWVSKVTPHTTGGKTPQLVRPGKGTGGRALEIFDMWDGADRGGGERIYSAAHSVVDFDGIIYVGGDLLWTMAYHAKSINPTSVGIEMCTYADGSIQEATLQSTALFIAALCHSGMPGSGLLPIPFQQHAGPYRNEPLRRLELNKEGLPGNDVVGVIGHREQTSQRGWGDPGDEIYRRLAALGCEAVDYNNEDDIVRGKQRQAALNARGAKLTVDGICGPASIAAMIKAGFKRWRDVV